MSATLLLCALLVSHIFQVQQNCQICCQCGLELLEGVLKSLSLWEHAISSHESRVCHDPVVVCISLRNLARGQQKFCKLQLGALSARCIRQPHCREKKAIWIVCLWIQDAGRSIEARVWELPRNYAVFHSQNHNDVSSKYIMNILMCFHVNPLLAAHIAARSKASWFQSITSNGLTVVASFSKLVLTLVCRCSHCEKPSFPVSLENLATCPASQVSCICPTLCCLHIRVFAECLGRLRPRV